MVRVDVILKVLSFTSLYELVKDREKWNRPNVVQEGQGEKECCKNLGRLLGIVERVAACQNSLQIEVS